MYLQVSVSLGPLHPKRHPDKPKVYNYLLSHASFSLSDLGNHRIQPGDPFSINETCSMP